MALAPSAMPDRRPSPGFALNLNSNNPFRNRAVSPAIPSPSLSPEFQPAQVAPNGRPLSRNPFLAPFEESNARNSSRPIPIPASTNMTTGQRSSPQKVSFERNARDPFNNLSISDNSAANGAFIPRPAQRPDALSGQGHRMTRSQEEDQRQRNVARGPPKPRGPPGELNIFGSPERNENRRPRRNSESSVMDKSSALIEEETRRKERRQRADREPKQRDGKPREGRPGNPRKPKGLDLIDKLDVTGIYGSGLFHHDGPFDACNPHRNRKRDYRAPMQAFPVGSANNALGGSGPVNKTIDLDQIHGRGAEGFTDYNSGNNERPGLTRAMTNLINPLDRTEPIHGEESVGLGTSTFLEGAPASRNAIQQNRRRESENEAAAFQGAGVQRKKSLAQRLRGISQPRRNGPQGDGLPVRSPEARYDYRRGAGATSPESPQPLFAQAGRGVPQSAGGRLGMYETNPFFSEYDDAYEKKGGSVRIAEAQSGENSRGSDRARAPSSPRRGMNGLERSVTLESIGERENKSSGGFLSRVKSLKGGRRARAEVRGP